MHSQALSRGFAVPLGCLGLFLSQCGRCTTDGRERAELYRLVECPAWSEPPSLPLQLRSRSPPPCHRFFTPGRFRVRRLRCRLKTVEPEEAFDLLLGDQDPTTDLHGPNVAPVDLVTHRLVGRPQESGDLLDIDHFGEVV